MRPRPPATLAISLGDPAGIGPEVALRAALLTRPRLACRMILIGDVGAAREAAKRLHIREELPAIPVPDLLAAKSLPRVVLAAPGVGWPLAELRANQRRPGHPTVAGAVSAFESIRTAVRLAQAGTVDAICTAPINKEWFARAGVARTGHTEILGALSGARGVRLMMVLDDLRVCLATSHIALRDVPSTLTTRGLVETIRVVAEHLRRWWGISRPRVAVAALNPHASDGGVYGDEEARVVIPAIRRARAARIAASGPFPADTLFSALGPACDAVVALYHDQGLIPIKQKDVHRAVNVTLGLPFVRTSPDHGTAYELAGKGRADPRSMRAALELAVELASHARKKRPARSARRPVRRPAARGRAA